MYIPYIAVAYMDFTMTKCIIYHFAKCTLQFSTLFCNFVNKQEKVYIYIVNISIYICLVFIFLLTLQCKHKGKGFRRTARKFYKRHIKIAARLPKAVYKTRQIIPGLPVDVSGQYKEKRLR